MSAGEYATDPLRIPMGQRASASHGAVGLEEEEARMEEGVRRGARRAIDEKEKSLEAEGSTAAR